MYCLDVVPLIFEPNVASSSTCLPPHDISRSMGTSEALFAAASQVHSLLDGVSPIEGDKALAEALEQLLGSIGALSAARAVPTRDSCLAEVQACCKAAEVLCRLQPKLYSLCRLQQHESVQAAAAVAATLLPASKACLDAALEAVAAHSAGLELPATCALLPTAVHAAASAAKVAYALQAATSAPSADQDDSSAARSAQQLLQCCDLLGSAARLPWVLFHGGWEPPSWPKPKGAQRFIDGHVATVVPAAVALLQQARAAAGAASNKQRGGPNAPNPSAEALLSRALGMAAAVLLPCHGKSIMGGPTMVEAAAGARLVQEAFLLIQVSTQSKEGAESATSFLGSLGTWLHEIPRIFAGVAAIGALHDFAEWLANGLEKDTAVDTSASHRALAGAFHQVLHSGAKGLANWVQYEESSGLGFTDAALGSQLAELRAELTTAVQAISTLGVVEIAEVATAGYWRCLLQPGCLLDVLRRLGGVLIEAWAANPHQLGALAVRSPPPEELPVMVARACAEQRACANPRCATLRGAGESQLDTLRCARCKRAFYCGRECQSEDWRQHKVVCRLLRDGKRQGSQYV